MRDALDVVAALASRTPATPRRQHAAIEAVRLRLRELFAAGCADKASVADLTATLLPTTAPGSERPGPLRELQLRLAKGFPDFLLASANENRSEWLALYRKDQGTVRTLIALAEKGPAMEQQLMLFDYAVLQPPGAAEPMLALVHSHPWVTSCWRDLQFRVLSPGATPSDPTVLFSKGIGGRVCEDATVTTAGDVVRFQFLGWTRRFMDEVMRPAGLELRYANGQFIEQYAHVAGPKHLVEDWLVLPWSTAVQLTLPEAIARLEPLHARLGSSTVPDQSSYSAELFPSPDGGRRVAIYCSTRERKPCPEWPRIVDVQVVQRGGHWLVADVQER